MAFDWGGFAGAGLAVVGAFLLQRSEKRATINTLQKSLLIEVKNLMIDLDLFPTYGALIAVGQSPGLTNHAFDKTQYNFALSHASVHSKSGFNIKIYLANLDKIGELGELATSIVAFYHALEDFDQSLSKLTQMDEKSRIETIKPILEQATEIRKLGDDLIFKLEHDCNKSYLIGFSK
jgi:hypothetical protein